MRPDDGRPETVSSLAPGLRRVLAPNPSPMTLWGTNSYLLGRDRLMVIDPGPEDPAHLERLLAAIGSATVSHILVTHAHLDHSPLAPALARETGAPVCAFGDARAGRSPVMERLAQAGLAGGGEGVDAGFMPDVVLADGETVGNREVTLTALHTPGHFGNHLSFTWGKAVFSGDLVMGWASTFISPPDGDLSQFRASVSQLRTKGADVLYPGHGAPVPDPAARCDWLLAHRQNRDTAIWQAIGAGGSDLKSITTRVYTDIPSRMLPAAERNVFAHLVDMYCENRISAVPDLTPAATFERR